MGAVYQAEDLLHGKICAVKEMLETSTSTEERHANVDRFISEVQVLQRLVHPNIPRDFGLFTDKNSSLLRHGVRRRHRSGALPGRPWQSGAGLRR